MRTFAPFALLAAAAPSHAMEIGTSAPPTLKYNDFVMDGKTTYCYTVKQGAAAAMYEYTQLGAEGKGDECPLQLTLEQTTTGAIGVNANVEYKLTATVSLSNKNVFNGTALEKTVEDPNTHRMVQVSSASVHACSSSSVCDAFRKGNSSQVSDDASGTFTDGKAVFTPKLNFTSADKYTVFAVVMLPGLSGLDETMRFVAYTTTTVGGGSSQEDVKNPDKSTVPSPSTTAPPKSAGSRATLAGTVMAGVTAAASLVFLAL